MDREKIFKQLGRIEPPEPLKIETGDLLRFSNRQAAFLEALEKAGGRGFVIEKERIEEKITELFPDTSVGSIYSYGCRILDPNNLEDPHDLQNLDVALIHGEFGVCENGAVWISEERNRHRALYTIVSHLVIVLPKRELVDTMIEAYERMEKPAGYALFLSGPSKTADIEQSLVIGAHGARSLTVLLV